jgi:hypothetical protein
MHPVAQRLAVHAADVRRIGPAPAVQNAAIDSNRLPWRTSLDSAQAGEGRQPNHRTSVNDLRRATRRTSGIYRRGFRTLLGQEYVSV